VNIYGVGNSSISKLDLNGDALWNKTIGGTVISSIDFDTFGGVYITGSFSGTIDFDPGSEIEDLTAVSNVDNFVLKLDTNGNYIWAKNFGNTSYGSTSYIALDSSSNVYITGQFSNVSDFDPGVGVVNVTSTGNSDIFIVKLDSDGNYVWAKNMGGENYDRAYFITLDSSDNVYTTGSFQGTADFDPSVEEANLVSSSNNAFISKLDNNGNYIWAKKLDYYMGYSMITDSSDNVYVTGYSNFYGIFISKVDSDGNDMWEFTLGSGVGNDLAVDSMNNVYITGYFRNTVDFDPSEDVADLTVVTNGNRDLFIAKYDPEGNYVWAKSIGSENSHNEEENVYADMVGNSILLDSSHNTYVAGAFAGTIDFDPGADVTDLASTTGVFLLKLSQTPPVSLPVLSTTTSTPTTDSLSLTSSITDTGGALLSERGFQYGTSESYGSTVTDLGSFDTGSYTTTISSLSCGTTYYFRSFGTNTAGTSYGAASSGTTAACPGVVFIPSGGFPPPAPAPSTPPSPTTIPPTEQPPVQEPQLVPPLSSSSFSRDITLTYPHQKGDDVTSLQTFLHSGGYPIELTPLQERTTRSPVDGIFGPRTQAALKLFQRARNIIVDGIFGEVTRGEVERGILN
jgi:peptidoglycan hydrolase-like protein with peptidoglycan-binding domain